MEITPVHIIIAFIALLHPIAVLVWAYFYKSPAPENRHFASGIVNRTGQPAPPRTENIERATSEREQAARIRRRIKSSKDSTTTKKRPRSKRFHLDDEASHSHHTHHSHHMHQHFKES